MSLTTDPDDRFSLLELDGPVSAPAPRPAPARPAPVPAAPVEPTPAPAPAPVSGPAPLSVAPTAAQMAATRSGRWQDAPRLPTNAQLASRAAARAAESAPAPVPGAATGSLGDALATAVAEGEHFHAQRDLVRGGVLRPDVNPVMGYNANVIAARGEATRYADEARNAALGTTLPAVKDGTELAGHLTNGNIIAGASKVRDGALVAWAGKHRRTRGQLVAALESAGLPVAWAPEAKSARAQAGAILAGVHTDGLIAKAVEADGKTQEQRGWIGLWNLGYTGDLDDAKSIGDNFGRVAMVAKLKLDKSLAITVGEDSHLRSVAASIVARYDARIAAEEFSAGDVTQWLSTVMHKRLGGVAFGPAGYYVKADNAVNAERLAKALKAGGWGQSWITIPVATSEQLRAGLVESLVDEARAVLVDYGTARDEAAESKRQISQERLTTLEGRMKEVLEHARGFAALLGDAAVANLRRAVRTALEEIEPQVSIEAARFAGIWDDLRAEGVLDDSIPAPIPAPVEDAPTVQIPLVEVPTAPVEVPAAAPVPVELPVERITRVPTTTISSGNVVAPTQRGPRRSAQPARVSTTTSAPAPVASAIQPTRATSPDVDVSNGRLVRVVSGRKVAPGTEGVVIRITPGQWGPRVLIKVASGALEWTSLRNVECVVDDNGRPLYPSIGAGQQTA